MKVKLKKLPLGLYFEDYHDFQNMQDAINRVVTGIRVIEFNKGHGMAYVGKLTDPKNAKMKKRIEAYAKEWEC